MLSFDSICSPVHRNILLHLRGISLCVTGIDMAGLERHTPVPLLVIGLLMFCWLHDVSDDDNDENGWES